MDRPSRRFPALDLQRPEDAAALERVLADLDDYSPTAVDDDATGAVRVFFGTAAARDDAASFLRANRPTLSIHPIDVPDEGWAERSQADLPPIRVGRLVVSSSPASPTDGSIGIVIRPSMGFGTGHHASTRLCLALLQRVPLAGVSVLDAGTGSGVLAIAAATLGARVVLAVDSDADALTAARESAALNERAGAVELRHLDLSSDLDAMAGHFDVITANLTGAFHERHAGAFARRLAAGGHLIASGIQLEEADRVEQAFATRGLVTIERSAEQEWVGFLLRNRVS